LIYSCFSDLPFDPNLCEVKNSHAPWLITSFSSRKLVN
jgi:hypothetical protein